MLILGAPDAVVGKLVHEDAEGPVVELEHERNEEIITTLEQEECPVTVSAEPLAMFLHESDDLRLREAQTVEIGRKTVVDLSERAVLNHLVDGDLLFLRRLARDVELPVAKVAVEVTVEGAPRLGNGFGAVRLVEGKRFRTRDELQTSADDLRHFRQKPLNEFFDSR